MSNTKLFLPKKPRMVITGMQCLYCKMNRGYSWQCNCVNQMGEDV